MQERGRPTIEGMREAVRQQEEYDRIKREGLTLVDELRLAMVNVKVTDVGNAMYSFVGGSLDGVVRGSTGDCALDEFYSAGYDHHPRGLTVMRCRTKTGVSAGPALAENARALQGEDDGPANQ